MMIRKIYRYIFDDEKNSEEEEVAAVDSSHTLMTRCHPAALITYYLLPLSFARISLPPACICFASCCLRAWHGRQPLRDAPCQFFFLFTFRVSTYVSGILYRSITGQGYYLPLSAQCQEVPLIHRLSRLMRSVMLSFLFLLGIPVTLLLMPVLIIGMMTAQAIRRTDNSSLTIMYQRSSWPDWSLRVGFPRLDALP